MTRKILILILILFSISTTAQEEVLSFTEDDDTSSKRSKDGYSFSNTSNGDLAIVFMDRKNVFANLFDSNFKKIASINGKALKRKYKNLLGYRINENKYELLAANNSLNKFVVQVLDFGTGKTAIKKMKIDLGKEEFIEVLHYKNDLLVITATKENQFVLRKLSDDFNFKELKRFDIVAEERDQKLLKSGFFTMGLFGGATSNVTKVDNRVPNAIEQTAKANKLYQSDNKIYLTIENEDELVTTLHIIDLESLTLSTKIYPYPKGNIDDFKAYNSFILEDKLLQMGSSPEEMKLVVKNFDNTIIKEFYLEKGVPIAIKNSPIIQEGRTMLPFQNRREMEKTSKFLRKVSSGNLGVTAYRKDDNYSFTIGGFKNVSNAGGGMMMMPGNFAGSTPITTSAGTVFIPTYNPILTSFNVYSSTKSTYFNTTLDQDFNYIKKEEESNIFDIIEDFKNEIRYNTADDYFFHNGELHFGYYNTKTKSYHLYKM
ncbi:hypothetical protein [Psychroflexus aestuariivivens]|uniref:hypothetical protein n=1 Tax=Psychroflexus aestuariivivens TaxID=1795040 RepID=UPI000FD6DCD6|nr:hypothetical protein [Psychroflexus aestuariivivens]